MKSGLRFSQDLSLVSKHTQAKGQYVLNLMTNILQLLRNPTAVSDSNYLTRIYAQREKELRPYVHDFMYEYVTRVVYCWGSQNCVHLSVQYMHRICLCSLGISAPNSVLISKVLPWHICMSTRKQLRLYGMTTGVMTIWVHMTTKGAAINKHASSLRKS